MLIGRFPAGGGVSGTAGVKVFAVTAWPAVVQENAIAVMTTQAITGSYMGADYPASPKTGEIYINTAARLQGEPSVQIGKNPVVDIRVNSVSQWDGTQWVKRDARLGKGGIWKDLVNVWYYDTGNECVEITGGWTVTGTNTSKEPNHLNLDYGRKGHSGTAYTNSMIDLSSIKVIHFQVFDVTSHEHTDNYLYIGSSPGTGNLASISFTNASDEYALNVSNLTTGYISFYSRTDTYYGGGCKISKAWGELL